MEVIYRSPITSERHQKYLYCEDGDFAEIQVIRLQEGEAPLTHVIDHGLGKIRRVRRWNGMYIHDLEFDGDQTWGPKQGKFTKNVLAEFFRDKRDHNRGYYPVFSRTYYVIGNTIYVEWCKVKELAVTQTGNLIFGDWWSMSVEPDYGKPNYPRLTPENYRKAIKEGQKRVDEANTDKPYKRHHFTYDKVRFVKTKTPEFA